MKKAVLMMVAVLVVVGLVLGAAEEAQARPKYKMAWDARYLKEGSAIHTALEGKSNCNVCHQGKNRKNRNAYGASIGKALGEKNVMDAQKIEAAIEKAEGEKPAGSDKTFGDQIKAGTLKPTVEEP